MRLANYAALAALVVAPAIAHFRAAPPAPAQRAIEWMKCRGGAWCRFNDLGPNLGPHGGEYFTSYFEVPGTYVIWEYIDGQPRVIERQFTKSLQAKLDARVRRYATESDHIYVSWTESPVGPGDMPWGKQL